MFGNVELFESSALLCMYMHRVELDRQIALVFSGSDQHAAITTSITTSSAFQRTSLNMLDAIEMTVLTMFVWSYRDEGTTFGRSLPRPRSVSS